MKVAVVIPVFNNTQALATLIERLFALEQPYGYIISLFLVDDGSRPAAWARLTALKKRYHKKNITLIRLKRNQGQHLATQVGLQKTTAPWVISMDADLQHPPEEIPSLLHSLVQEKKDLVYGTAAQGHSGWYQKISHPYRFLVAFFDSNPNVVASSFRGINGQLIDNLKKYHKPYVSLDEPLKAISNNAGVVLTRHDASGGKKSSYTLSRKVGMALSIILTSSVFLTILFCLLFTSILVGIIFVFFGVDLARIAGAIVFFASALLLCLRVRYANYWKNSHINTFVAEIIK